MQVTTADLWEPAPGTILRWDVKAGGSGTPAVLSLNQRNHLAGAMAGEASVWLAGAFDTEGPIDAVALGHVWHAFVERHSSLQLEVARTATGPAAYRHHPGGLVWTMAEVGATSTTGETRKRLQQALAEGCHPFGYPAYVPLAVSRPDRSTIVLGMDHLHGDAYSIALVVDEVATLYESYRDGFGRPALPETACFLAGVEREYDEPVQVWHDDDRLLGWHAFLRARDFVLPTFPLGLGVAPGERVRQASLVREIADHALVERVAVRARDQGASTYAAALVALAGAIHDLGGPERLDTLAPVQTRSDRASRRAVGWYTTTVPISVAADLSDRGLAAAGAAVRAGMRLGEVPLDQVMASLPEPLVQARRDVFMVSWIDYRHLPGNGRAGERAAHHISAPTLADDLQLWLSRTDAGLAARVRFPDAPAAHAAVTALLERFGERLREIAGPVS
ncbi:hypothetical protein AB3X52_05870 [Nocardioides sp. DS6]|uniref:Condensation domain-containing protein n=1 Tax=Nocardioides eburneus TaxID=3231482 RepID=A0ABV3SW28_9ACTN